MNHIQAIKLLAKITSAAMEQAGRNEPEINRLIKIKIDGNPELQQALIDREVLKQAAQANSDRHQREG